MPDLKKSRKRLSDAFNSLEFSAIWILVVVPLLSLLFISVSGESPLYTSISRIAWVAGHRWFMLVWSLVVLFPMVCLARKVIRTSALRPRWKKALTFAAIANILVSFVGGVFVPAKSGALDISFFGVLHDLMTAIGWLSFGVVLTAYSICLFSADRKQAILALSFMIFVWMTGVFFIFYVIDPGTYCGSSTITQVYIINMLDLFLLMNDIYQTRGAQSVPPAEGNEKK